MEDGRRNLLRITAMLVALLRKYPQKALGIAMRNTRIATIQISVAVLNTRPANAVDRPTSGSINKNDSTGKYSFLENWSFAN